MKLLNAIAKLKPRQRRRLLQHAYAGNPRLAKLAKELHRA